jgi:hypothetical protein
MKTRARDSVLGSLILALIFLMAGLGLIAGAINKALPLARARIQLERRPVHGVTGSLSFVLAGVPIFWRNLDGFDHLENQDFERHHMQRNRYRGQMTISRLGFVNAAGETLAWTERAPVMNDADLIRQFLDDEGEKNFEYQQEPPYHTTYHDIERALLALMLVILGSVLVLLGLRVASRTVLRRAPESALSD